MTIAVAAQKKTETAEISMQAGRAPFLLLFDESGASQSVLKNPFKSGGGGAGFGVAKMLADNDVTIFVAGKIGENMRGALEEKHIRWYEMEGTVSEALERVTQGEQ